MLLMPKPTDLAVFVYCRALSCAVFYDLTPNGFDNVVVHSHGSKDQLAIPTGLEPVISGVTGRRVYHLHQGTI